MAEISIKDLRKIYEKEIVAVKDLTVTFPAGEITSLLGPSGCGKTTTLRLIAGLEDATSGSILFDEEEVTQLSPSDRDVAMVFQFPALYPNLTLLENISFPLYNSGVPGKEIEEQVEEVVDFLDMGDLSSYPQSAGAALTEKVAIAKSVIRDPEVFLFDEPLAHISPDVKPQFRGLIQELAEELNETFVYVTHNQSEALTIADNIALMRKGSLLQIGGGDELYKRPTNEFVAWFLGNPGMNFVPGTFSDTQKSIRFGKGEYFLSPDRHMRTGKIDNNKLDVGFRPEIVDLSLEKNEGQGEDSWYEASVEMVKMTGPQDIVLLNLDGETFTSKTELKGLSFGETVYFHISPEDLHLFNSETGELLL